METWLYLQSSRLSRKNRIVTVSNCYSLELLQIASILVVYLRRVDVGSLKDAGDNAAGDEEDDGEEGPCRHANGHQCHHRYAEDEELEGHGLFTTQKLDDDESDQDTWKLGQRCP